MKYIDCYPNNSGGYICLGCAVNQGGPFNWHEDITWATPTDYACSQWHAAQVGGGTIRPKIDANAVPNRTPKGLRRKFSGFTQGICDDGECLVNGICMDCGLAPGRTHKPPLYSTQADDPNLRQVGGDCAPLCGTPPKCYPCGTGPTYPQKQVANPGCYPPCGKDEYCEGGQCYSGQPSARQNIISRCDSYNPNCPGPRESANYRSKSGQCCSKGALRQTSARRRR